MEAPISFLPHLEDKEFQVPDQYRKRAQLEVLGTKLLQFSAGPCEISALHRLLSKAKKTAPYKGKNIYKSGQKYISLKLL